MCKSLIAQLVENKNAPCAIVDSSVGRVLSILTRDRLAAGRVNAYEEMAKETRDEWRRWRAPGEAAAASRMKGGRVTQRGHVTPARSPKPKGKLLASRDARSVANTLRQQPTASFYVHTLLFP